MATFKEKDHVLATIGRKDVVQRETHPGVVKYVTPAERLTNGVQTYHVTIAALHGDFCVDEGDLAPAPPPPPPAGAEAPTEAQAPSTPAHS